MSDGKTGEGSICSTCGKPRESTGDWVAGLDRCSACGSPVTEAVSTRLDPKSTPAQPTDSVSTEPVDHTEQDVDELALQAVQPELAEEIECSELELLDDSELEDAVSLADVEPELDAGSDNSRGSGNAGGPTAPAVAGDSHKPLHLSLRCKVCDTYQYRAVVAGRTLKCDVCFTPLPIPTVAGAGSFPQSAEPITAVQDDPLPLDGLPGSASDSRSADPGVTGKMPTPADRSAPSGAKPGGTGPAGTGHSGDEVEDLIGGLQSAKSSDAAWRLPPQVFNNEMTDLVEEELHLQPLDQVPHDSRLAYLVMEDETLQILKSADDLTVRGSTTRFQPDREPGPVGEPRGRWEVGPAGAPIGDLVLEVTPEPPVSGPEDLASRATGTARGSDPADADWPTDLSLAGEERPEGYSSAATSDLLELYDLADVAPPPKAELRLPPPFSPDTAEIESTDEPVGEDSSELRMADPADPADPDPRAAAASSAAATGPSSWAANVGPGWASHPPGQWVSPTAQVEAPPVVGAEETVQGLGWYSLGAYFGPRSKESTGQRDLLADLRETFLNWPLLLFAVGLILLFVWLQYSWLLAFQDESIWRQMVGWLAGLIGIALIFPLWMVFLGVIANRRPYLDEEGRLEFRGMALQGLQFGTVLVWGIPGAMLATPSGHFLWIGCAATLTMLPLGLYFVTSAVAARKLFAYYVPGVVHVLRNQRQEVQAVAIWLVGITLVGLAMAVGTSFLPTAGPIMFALYLVPASMIYAVLVGRLAELALADEPQ